MRAARYKTRCRPANAGTHTPGRCSSESLCSSSFIYLERRWLMGGRPYGIDVPE